MQKNQDKIVYGTVIAIGITILILIVTTVGVYHFTINPSQEDLISAQKYAGNIVSESIGAHKKAVSMLKHAQLLVKLESISFGLQFKALVALIAEGLFLGFMGFYNMCHKDN